MTSCTTVESLASFPFLSTPVARYRRHYSIDQTPTDNSIETGRNQRLVRQSSSIQDQSMADRILSWKRSIQLGWWRRRVNGTASVLTVRVASNTIDTLDTHYLQCSRVPIRRLFAWTLGDSGWKCFKITISLRDRKCPRSSSSSQLQSSCSPLWLLDDELW